MSGIDRLHPLMGTQDRASNPSGHAALSASAGTGKTHVLTSRVLRLLLRGVSPGAILCLTFTKAAAAEMAERISSRLADWVRLDEQKLRADLAALNEPTDADTQARARRLFAELLDTPGGLRIQTIHAFSQSLLASFPAEAGIAPGFEAIDDQAADELAEQVLADLAASAETSPRPEDRQFLDDLATMSLRMGQDAATGYLRSAAGHARAFEKLALEGDPERWLRALADLPETGDPDAILAQRIAQIDGGLFDRMIAAHEGWATKTGAAAAARLREFSEASAAKRVALLPKLASGIVTGEGNLAKNGPKDEHYPADAEQFREWWLPLVRLGPVLEWTRDAGASLRAASRFVSAYAQAKRARGLADFSDLIDWTLRLLDQPGIGEWVRFKLDQRIDHVLVDEAQDTNADQWAIIQALVDEYFTGDSEVEERFRTLFMVGDFKQAIYGFQGSDPQQFDAARARFKELADANIAAANENDDPLAFEELQVGTSFRSAPAILDLVNATIAHIRPETMGLADMPAPHRVSDRMEDVRSRVELWPPFVLEEDDEDAVGGEENWTDKRDRAFAGAMADAVKKMVDEEGVQPGDIMILLRRRSELASLIVARLFAAGVPVAGIDRLFLARPLAVQDLLAAMRFASQPRDDLSLACLLVGPLFGWSQERLQELAIGREGTLWDALRRDDGEDARTAVEGLSRMLAMADYVGPAIFLETILSGPLDGRRKLMKRLGEEARDPIDELLGQALDFEARETASLDAFLDRMSSDDTEIKRESAGVGDQVRVMTVHGSKGLEAPVVILGDATWDPDQGGVYGPVQFELDPVGRLPIIRPSKSRNELTAPFEQQMEVIEAKEREEHWRLLYVAMTRAEHRLIVAGTMPRPRSVNKPAKVSDESWHAQVRQTMEGMEDTVSIPAPWEGEQEGLALSRGSRVPGGRRSSATSEPTDLPAWLRDPAPQEARPPRPLSPSAIEGEDELTFPPMDASQQQAARRGTLIHALLERLPQVEAADRRDRAHAWLEHSHAVVDIAEREALIDAALGVIEDDRFAHLFGPGSLAEAPLAATLEDGRVIAGTVDRLLVTDDGVDVIDYKTGLNIPASVDEIPRAYRAQMKAYADALAVIFPGKKVRAHLLYSAGPTLLTLD
ncbi:double-strand break repair helicase AddA [Sphingomicrobium sediminis]|uniref:DNA 3'-5' helicase n=1 Tax=Sphingomicrobium sediminis TaxID=2950949 RepID=A0A9X2EFB1_9SPHN|nr:double-strand break repair helicase AddA [Sphingomicrobium sediminis]MCM8556878.1 double-strand break repair helicase AddA [Sphingomicrobium sediminis]